MNRGNKWELILALEAWRGRDYDVDVHSILLKGKWGRGKYLTNGSIEKTVLQDTNLT